MHKGKFIVLSLIAAALVSWQMMPAETVSSGVVNPCSSTASVTPYVDGVVSDTVYCLLVCPQGDGDVLAAIVEPQASGPHDATISVTVKDDTGAPIPGIPATDFWLIGWNDALILCGGGGAVNASAATDVNGQTTIIGAYAAGGCDTGVQVVVQGTVLADPADWNNPLCLPISVKSPDRMDAVSGLENPDLIVSLSDFGRFGDSFPTPPPGNPNPPWDNCADYNCSGLPEITLADFGIFGDHFEHDC